MTVDAREHAEHAHELFLKVGDRFMTGWASYTLGLADLTDHQAGGDAELLDSAREHLGAAVRIFREAQDVSGYTLVLDALAIAAGRAGDRERAARLLGAVSTLERRSGTGLNPWNRGVLDFDADELRSDPSLANAVREGEAMSNEEAVAYALDE
jgi:hypothetical protein